MRDVDVQLLEVGLGGRLDAVNIVDPDVAIVTTIAIDHVDWLGHTVEAIGREKAGIFRGGVPAIIGDEHPPSSAVAICARKTKRWLLQLGQHFFYRKHVDGWDWRCADRTIAKFAGTGFQRRASISKCSGCFNGCKSFANRCCRLAKRLYDRVCRTAKLQGRFQLLRGEIPVLLDVGHNPQAVNTLVDYLQEAFPAVKVHAVFAMMKDKDIAGVLSIMRDHVAVWYLAPFKNPRAASEELLKQLFSATRNRNRTCWIYRFFGSL